MESHWVNGIDESLLEKKKIDFEVVNVARRRLTAKIDPNIPDVLQTFFTHHCFALYVSVYIASDTYNNITRNNNYFFLIA